MSSSNPIRWHDYVAEQLGTHNWVIASGLTPRLRERGFDKAVSQGRIDTLRAQWIGTHPGVIAAVALPESSKRAWLIEAARHYVEALAEREVRVLDHERTVEAHRAMCGLAA